MLRRTAALAAAALLLTGTAACGSDSSSDKASSTGGPSAVKVTGDVGSAPTVKVDSSFDVSKTETETLVKGDGPALEADGTALLNIAIYNGTNGKKAYSSYDAGKPEVVTLTQGKFLDELLKPLEGATEGSRLVVTSTVAKGIGADGATQIGLAKDQDVVFVIDVMTVAQQPTGDAKALPSGFPAIVDSDGKVTGIDFSKADKTASDKLQVETVIQGDGPAIAKGDTAVVNYYGVVYGGKKAFDESFSGSPASFPVGVGGLIKGWDEGLIGVKAGSRVMMVIPSDLAYGKKGSPPSIPADSDLVFVIDVLGVAPAAS